MYTLPTNLGSGFLGAQQLQNRLELRGCFCVPCAGVPLVADTFAQGAAFGNYVVVRKLGEGGMGEVYEGRHLQLNKKVAIKTLHPHMAKSPNAVSRFLREGQAASRIDHPHVVDVTDVGVSDEGVPYLVMELLEGESLHAYVRRSHVLPVTEIANLMIPVCAALAVAHDEGVVHRDIKPENIFLAHSRTGHVVPKLVDFGISKINSGDDHGGLTRSATVFGTPHYMAPEHARGTKNVGPASDLYSIGVILYELSCGRRPHDGDSTLAIIHDIVAGKFDSPRAINKSIPIAFEQVILRAMQAQPEKRYPDARALGNALLPFANAEVQSFWGDFFAGTVRQRTYSNDPAPPSTATVIRERTLFRRLTSNVTLLAFAAAGTLVLLALWFAVGRGERPVARPIVAPESPAPTLPQPSPAPTTQASSAPAAEPQTAATADMVFDVATEAPREPARSAVTRPRTAPTRVRSDSPRRETAASTAPTTPRTIERSRNGAPIIE